MLTRADIQLRLYQELYTIVGDYAIDIDDRLYTDDEYEDLKEMLLRLHELGLTPQQMQQLTTV